MTYAACESKLRSAASHPCIRYWVAIGYVVVYYARAAHALSAGIKCRHCIMPREGNHISRNSNVTYHHRVVYSISEVDQSNKQRPVLYAILSQAMRKV